MTIILAARQAPELGRWGYETGFRIIESMSSFWKPKPEDIPEFPPQDENGVDLSLVESCLRMTPTERIERHYQARLFVEELRRAGERYYGTPFPDPEALE